MGIIILVLITGLLGNVSGCTFPKDVSSTVSGPLVGKIRSQRNQGRLLVYFSDYRMSVFVHKGQGIPDLEPTGKILYNRTCVNAISSKKFLVSHEEDGKEPQYMCMEIVVRNKGVFQLKTSRFSKHIEPLLCYRTALTLDPWLFVSFKILKKHHQVCSFSGGFNMKIHSAQGNAYGCNSMELPMRLESECIGGDGVKFQFRYETCKEDLPMDVDQRTYCVAGWTDKRYGYSVLRKIGHDDLWCLRVPLVRRQNFTAVLFLDAMCSSDEILNSSANHVSLNLNQEQQDEICLDEYAGCTHKRCTPYTEASCQKSCGLCRPARRTHLCKFLIPYRGDWLQNNFDSIKQININTSRLAIQNVGTFKCVPGGNQAKGIERKYALMSLFENGCRPRYTCIAFRRFGHSVLSYTLGQSITWPFPPRSNIPEAVCEDSSFAMDPRPIRDYVRGRLDTFKTVVSTGKPALVNCQFRKAFHIRGSFNGSETCEGNLYQDCNEPTRARMEFADCSSIPPYVDFQCLSVYEGRYWENITIVQNINDPSDARCFVLSEVRTGEMLMMAAGECDKHTWLWEVAGERTALSKFQYQEEDVFCKVIPTEPPTTTEVFQEVTSGITIASTPPLRDTNPDNSSEFGQNDAPRLSTSPPTPPSKDESLRDDSGSVGVVLSPDNPHNSALGTKFTRVVHTVLFATLTAVFIGHVIR